MDFVKRMRTSSNTTSNSTTPSHTNNESTPNRAHRGGDSDNNQNPLEPSTKRKSQIFKTKACPLLDPKANTLLHFKLDCQFPSIWNEYRKNNILCDGIIKTCDKKVLSNLLLIKNSYFKSQAGHFYSKSV